MADLTRADPNALPKLGVLRILRILVEVSEKFGTSFHDDVHFVQGITKVARREKTWVDVGDVDIAIKGENFAVEFWKFLKALSERGLLSVWDVCEVPREYRSSWKSCQARREHPLSWTLDCEKNWRSDLNASRQYNLDIKIDASLVRNVPLSSTWMYGNFNNVDCNDALAHQLHSAFLDSELVAPRPNSIRFGTVLPLIQSFI